MQPNFDALYRALVTSTVDPTGKNKIKVQCPQIGGLAEIREAEPINPHDPVPGVGSTVWIGFSGGDLTKPFYFANADWWLSTGASLYAQSGTFTSSPDAATLDLVAGVNNAKTGNGAAPYVQIIDSNGTSAVDLYLSGSIIYSDAFGSSLGWQTPTYQTNWTSSSVFGPALRYRIENDNLFFTGSVNATAAIASGTNTFATIGGIYIPSATQTAMCLHTSSANVNIEACQFRVTSSGQLQFASGAISSGDRFQINVLFPLGHLS
jgi:hypothetical protein